jgi:serine/threonine-protein kinase
LEHAHGANLVHRDVKPANLLIDREGVVKILDFGLARMAEDEFSMAMIFGQDQVGTVDYVAPEQSIDSFAVDGRADIYSLGCTFYFALSVEIGEPDPGGAPQADGQTAPRIGARGAGRGSGDRRENDAKAA